MTVRLKWTSIRYAHKQIKGGEILDTVQEFIVETDSVDTLDAYLSLVLRTALTSTQKIGIKIIADSPVYLLPSVLINPENRSLPVILIKGWFASKNTYFDNSWKVFDSEESATQYILGLIKDNKKHWSNNLTKKFGDGFTATFNRFDGCVGVGYQIRVCHEFPEKLAISIVYIYYGK